jgi:NADH-quinone oxidoreductase chain G
MVKVKINNQEVLVPAGISVLEACKYIGIDIPRFCYHERLSVAGNCRMCLVEIEKSPKPVASCAMPISPDMSIYTESPLVKKARENVLETLLLNHPLDCPICDQGGECDLQDQTRLFGGDYSRFYVPKRAVEDKYCGPLIKTIMTRCIHCTRCVRYASEVAGVDILGTLNRGGHTEIGAYLDKVFETEIAGNVIDLCPVGALTSKPYAFTTRPWELRTVESIDSTDNLGSNIYIDFKESEILRVTPRLNEDLNQEWISDKARFSYDGLRRQRLYKIYYKKEKTNPFTTISWDQTFLMLQNLLNNNRNLFLLGSSMDTESLEIFSKLNNKANIRVRGVENFEGVSDSRVNFSFVQSIDNSDCCFLLGVNPRLESAVLNIRLRSQFQKGNYNLYHIGTPFKSNMPINFIGLSSIVFGRILEGKSFVLKRFKKPVFVLGAGISRIFGKENISNALKTWNPNSLVLNLSTFSNLEGAKFVGLKSFNKSDIEWSENIFFVQVEDTVQLRKILKAKNKFSVWIHSHGSNISTYCNLLLPVSTHVESESIFFNLEGRPQRSYKVVSPVKEIRSLTLLGKALFFEVFTKSFSSFKNTFLSVLEEGKNFSSLSSTVPKFKIFVTPEVYSFVFNRFLFKSNLEDFYISSFSTKSSLIMGQSSQISRQKTKNFLR